MLRTAVLVLSVCAVAISIEVQTSLGEVRGLRSEEGDYNMFLGVPYALVNEDDPFGAPIPHPGYAEPVEAYTDNIFCPQIRGGSFTGTLECLTLNIYVPDTADEGPLPVLVWVHGGAWVEGSGHRSLTSPNFLVKHGVIIVTVQYRVGMYGFLCTDSPKAPGNAGLRDQLLGFRWIKNHIQSFGGDPDKVTVFAESAGGMSLHLHLLSHHEKLFERAIIQSGSSSSPWTTVDQHNHVPIEVARALGFETEDLEEAIDFIGKANIEDVVNTAADLRIATAVNNNQPLTKACVEREFEGIERFVPIHPNIAHSDKVKDMDIMIGYNSEEMIFQYAGRVEEFYNDFSFRDLLNFGYNVTGMEQMTTLLRHFYIGDEETTPDLEQEIVQYGSDFVWAHPTERAIRLFLEDEVRVIYQYLFSYEGGRNFLKVNINTTVPGAAHADELGYLFDMNRFRDQEDTPEDLRVVDQMTTMWTNFVKYGNPTPEVSDLLPVRWEPLTAERRRYLNIDKDLTLGTRPFHDRVAFWDLFYETNRQQADGFSTL
nr:acetylcholine esterase [Ectropis obliqua]